MSTGSHLKIRSVGDNAHGVDLRGNRALPEHATFLVFFPGGDVEVARTSEGDYWIHIRVNRPHDGGDPTRPMGRLVDARLDVTGRHTVEVDVGDFNDPNLHHLAVRIGADQ